MSRQQAITWPDPDRDPAVRVNDPDTSVQPSEPRMSKGRWAVLGALYRRSEATDFELGEAVGMPPTGAGKRRLELQRAGLVEEVGVGTSPFGRPAKTWRLTDRGRALYREVAS